MIKAADALQKLLDGNNRFCQGDSQRTHLDGKRRSELLTGENPFAVIVCCSDSRVPPELIFDQGLGDLFVVRNAGQIVDAAALGSIEYAVAKLGVPLIFVLGHGDCGAVKAAVAGAKFPGHLNSVIAEIEPAVVQARAEQGDLMDNATAKNVDLIIEKISQSEPILKDAIAGGQVQITGGVYHLASGQVKLRP